MFEIHLDHATVPRFSMILETKFGYKSYEHYLDQ